MFAKTGECGKVGRGTFPDEGGQRKINIFCENGVAAGAFLKIPRIVDGTKIDQWRQDRHRDPLNTLSRSGFGQTWKINEILIGKWKVFDGLKPLKVCSCRRFHDL